MENLSTKELYEALNCIKKLASCPVCLMTLTPEVALCVRGHAVCMPCRKRLQKPECPLCRDDFSNVKPMGFIHQVIESLPHPCRYKGCDYFVRTDDNHETFCFYKSTKCRYCEWSGPEKDIVDHLKTKHIDVKKYFVPLIGHMENGIPFNPKKECSVFTPIYVEGHFFWGEMKNEPRKGKLTAIFHPVANGKATAEFKGSVKLSGKSSYSADITLNMDPVADPYAENCISIPTSILDKFTVKDNFEYRLQVDVIILTSLTSLVQSGIESGLKSGIECWKSLSDNFSDIINRHK